MRYLLHIDFIQEILDADDTPLRDYSGHTMARDIVQFVPFRELMKKAGPSGNVVRIHPLVSQSCAVLYPIQTCIFMSLYYFLCNY